MQSGEDAVGGSPTLGERDGQARRSAAPTWPGFVVNRSNRPFGLEALRCLGERVADVETIDRIFRLGGGFRMGPFELQDLVGIDVGYEVGLSLPRARASASRAGARRPLSARMVAAGRLGRKSGRGWYDVRRRRPPPPRRSRAPGATAGATVEGVGPLADALKERAAAAGGGGPTMWINGLGGLIEGEPFYALLPLGLVEVTGDAGERAFSALGLHTARVRPSPGGVLPRMVCQLVNEAHFSLGEGVASAQDIDDGLRLGLNHPRGPLAWGELLGLGNVRQTLAELREVHGDAYRIAPALR